MPRSEKHHDDEDLTGEVRAGVGNIQTSTSMSVSGIVVTQE